MTAYDSVKARITALVDELLAANPTVDWTIYVTGHSLGGALATLSAFDFATRRYVALIPPPFVAPD